MRVAYYNNILCVEAGWLIEEEIISQVNYKLLCHRSILNVIRRGCRNTPALVTWKSIPSRFKKIIVERFYDPEKKDINLLEEFIVPDTAAFDFFSSYVLSDGRGLPYDPENNVVLEYYNQAIILNAVGTLFKSRKKHRKMLGNSTVDVWKTVSKDVNALNTKIYKHKLPTCDRRLRDKFNRYTKEGYQSLIHSNFCNNSARKVTASLERLLLSIYCKSNNPYVAWVCDDYLRFLSGSLEIVDMESGELFNRADFYNEKGEPIVVSEATVWNYINKPENRAIVDSIRLGYHKFNSLKRPHYHRHAPNYGLSKISLDDRDLPRRLHNGGRVKVYYAYDVASGALIGSAYSLKKDGNLFIDCIRDMFRFIDRNKFGIPLEMEVENHLVKSFEDDLMKAGNVFPFVRWCAPTNSQEKSAEQFNRQKKYGYEKRYQDGIGRFYARNEANQTNGERVYDEIQNKYVIKEKTYSKEQLIADDRAMINAYNNGLHRDQKRYKGKTRLQVLMENINPDFVQINRSSLARYIGNCTITSIQRNQYVQVQDADYQLSSPDILKRLAPGNYTVHAYWMPSEDSEINSVYLYQTGEFICEATKIITFNTATAERDDADIEAMTNQAKYISLFDKTIKESKKNLAKTKFIENNIDFNKIQPEILRPKEPKKENEDLESLIESYSGGWKEHAIEVL